MKKILFLLFAVVTLCSLINREAAIPYELNVLTDLPTFLGTPNLNGDSVHGDTKLLQMADSALLSKGWKCRLRFPQGVYRLDTTYYPQDDRYLVSDNWCARFVCTSLLPTGANMIESIAHSRVVVDGIWFTNWHVKEMNAFIQWKTDPRKCTGNGAYNCLFTESWCHAGAMGGDAGTNDSTHWNQKLTFKKDIFSYLYNPSYKVITTDLGNDNLESRGVMLQTTTLQSLFDECSFVNTSGDGIHSNGANYGLRNKKDIGNITVLNSYFQNNLCNVVVLGPYYTSGFTAINNRFYYATRNGGYNLSIQGKNKKLLANDFLNADRTFIENTGIGDIIMGNTGKLICWSDTSQGYQPTAKVARVCFSENSGFNGLEINNVFTADHSNPNTYSPDEFNGFKIVSRTNGNSTTTQDTAWGGVTDLPAFWKFDGNTLTGITHKVVDATNDKVRYVTFTNNRVFLNTMVASPIEIYGYTWDVSHNKWFMTGNASPSGGNALIRPRTNQSDNNGSVVTDNPVFGNDAWKSVLYK